MSRRNPSPSERSRRSGTPERSFHERSRSCRSPSSDHRRNRSRQPYSNRESAGRESLSRKHRSRSPNEERRRNNERSKGDDRRRRDRNRTDSDDSEDYDRRRRMAKRDKKRETSEDRARRKAERKAEKQAATSTPDDSLPYSNDNNPFNDPNLGQKFVWAKKKVRDAKLGISQSELARKERDRREETKAELEKLAKRRAEREIELQLREAEMMRMQREADLAALGDWEVKEDEFHLEQAKKRAEIRIKENRAKPIDILAINMRLAEGGENEDDDIGMEVDVEEPYHIFDNLLLEEVEELHKDIQFYLSLEKNQLNVEFWRAMIVVAEDRLVRMQATSSSLAKGAYDAVSKEAEIMLSGKSYDQLVTLQKQIQRKLAGNEPMDIEYWEGLLKALTVWKAKAKLKDMHQIMLQKRLEQLRAAQRLEARKEQSEVAAALAGQPLTALPVVKGTVVAEEEEEEEDDEEDAEAAAQAQMIPYEHAMSPEPFDGIGREDRDLRVVDPEEDWQQLLERRAEVEKNKLVPLKSQAKATEEAESGEADVSSMLYSKEANKQADLDELVFNTEAELAKTTYLWQDKYRPRKPRYFNRVHTGYEWNKYNQTHYDTDNPPPKIVQGYKFNIFYPDLIDKNRTPTYRIEKEPGTTETVLIRFIGGPPYEDIAFRVVNREWEYSHKKGFKSSFDRGVLQLHMHFKRNFYRK